MFGLKNSYYFIFFIFLILFIPLVSARILEDVIFMTNGTVIYSVNTTSGVNISSGSPPVNGEFYDAVCVDKYGDLWLSTHNASNSNGYIHKINGTDLSITLFNLTTTDNVWSTDCTSDINGNMWFASYKVSSSRLIKINITSGNFIEYNFTGMGLTTGLCSDFSGGIYAVSQESGFMYKVNSTTGVNIWNTTKKMSNPQNCVVDRKGNVYVSDYSNNKVAIFNSSSTNVRNLSVPTVPVEIKIDKSASNQKVYVATRNGQTVTQMNLTTTLNNFSVSFQNGVVTITSNDTLFYSPYSATSYTSGTMNFSGSDFGNYTFARVNYGDSNGYLYNYLFGTRLITDFGNTTDPTYKTTFFVNESFKAYANWSFNEVPINDSFGGCNFTKTSSSTTPMSFNVSSQLWEGDWVNFSSADYKTVRVNCTHYTNSFDSLNSSYVLSIKSQSSTCSCPVLDSNWEVDLSEYCWINDACDIGNGVLNWTFNGNFTINASVNVSNMTRPPNSSVIYVKQDGVLWI